MDEIKQLCRVHPHNELLLDQGDATFEFKRRSNYHFSKWTFTFIIKKDVCDESC